MERNKAKKVRFTAVVARAGKPDVYLPLLDPERDRAFMRAAKENRVLSIRQEPASERADYGIVGFDQQKHTTYLVFPKPLTAFDGAHVIGIKYDVVGSSPVTSAASRGWKMKERAEEPALASKSTRAPRVKKIEPKPPAPPKHAQPRPKEFRVHLRITTVIAKDVTVKAMTKAEAKKKAQAAVDGEDEARAVSVSEV